MNMRKPGTPPSIDHLFFNGAGRAEVLKSREKGFSVGAATKPSELHPDHSEDRYTATPSTIVIYDGMGGSERGEKGAILAKEEVENGLHNLPPQPSAEKLAQELNAIIFRANKNIYNQSELNNDGTRKGHEDIGSTISLLKIWEGNHGEKKVVVANVGDSRVYRLRHGELTQLTHDDGAPDEILEHYFSNKNISLEERNKIKALFDNFETPNELQVLTAKEKQIFSDMFRFRRNTTQALGKENIEVRTAVYDLEPGDEFFAMSDGIHDPYSNRQIRNSLTAHPERSPAQKAQDLVVQVEEANKAGVKRFNFDRNKYDDKTVVALKYEGAADEDALELNSDLLQEDPDEIMDMSDFVVEVGEEGELDVEKQDKKAA